MKRFLYPLLLIALLCNSCSKETPLDDPQITEPENSDPINTGRVSFITTNSAMVTGFVNLKDEYPDSVVGIKYSTDSLMQSEVTTVSISVQEVDANGSFEIKLDSLDCDVEYWYRAYMITTDGNEHLAKYVFSFRTSGLQVSVYTNPATDIFASSAHLNGTIGIKGAETDSVALWFIWGSSNDEDELADTLGIADASPAAPNGSFSAKITRLTYGVKYWYQAICSMNGSEYSGKIQSFTVDNENEEFEVSLPEYTECMAVDLHLPSGTKWCSYNLGGKSVTDCGDYYAWGDTLTLYETNGDEKTWPNIREGVGYVWQNCPYWLNGDNAVTAKFSKYNSSDSLGVLQPMDDAAYCKMGGNWRIPTLNDWAELQTYCDWFWYEADSSDVKGYVVMDATENGNSIFIPAGGYYNGTELTGPRDCVYWSSKGGYISGTEPYARGVAYKSSLSPEMTSVEESNDSFWYSFRYYGAQIRPVCSESVD